MNCNLSKILEFIARERRKMRRKVNLLDAAVPSDLSENGAPESNSTTLSQTDSITRTTDDEKGASAGLSVEASDEMMVIRLDAVDEDNYGSIISVLKERGKSWELTNLDGERVLKILP
jgi:hypothetical protein